MTGKELKMLINQIPDDYNINFYSELETKYSEIFLDDIQANFLCMFANIYFICKAYKKKDKEEK